MNVLIKKAGSNFYFLPLLLFFILPLVTPPLAANGSREFSEGYKTDLQNLFEEVIFKVESGEMSGFEAKTNLSLLRSKYRVNYNDFAGKIDAIIDEVEESKKDYLEALNDFIIIQNNAIKAREQVLKNIQIKASEINQSNQNTTQEGSSSSEDSRSSGNSGDHRGSGKK